ncbi:methyl-accepting chemotaxis protein [Salinicola rhizosphaerae]|uniref:Methyl-accepting chemotaxis protein n=1 Tax=Salinicola rhizosphaerae TaxID=1443141 RepID=A0ABQ3E0X4_9GAMM|nr:methyl-accepting chemotaxis protein [Salinicola rhizosphaerae]GHB22167.1 methyl-accepting chemotaxis protein [Salinicola rhizosphaerae]
MSLRRQRWIGIAILWVIVVGMLVINAWQMRDALVAEREQRMVTAVDMGVSLLGHYQQLAANGAMQEADARQAAFEALREIRFENDSNYVFAFGGDLKIRAHPKREQGQDVSQATDPTGKRIFPAMIDAARTGGHGFADYRSNFARGAESQPRVHAYVARFAPWDLYVASGVFMGDVDDQVLSQLLHSSVVGLVAGMLVTLAFWFMIARVLRRLGGEPAYAAGVVERIAAGDLTGSITTSNGTHSLLRDIQRMQDELQQAVSEIHVSSSAVEQGAAEISAGNQELASRTEEQAAALQQTSSSMEEMTATTRHSADNASRARELVERTGETSQEGQASVLAAVESMEEIRQSAGEITEIIGLIDNIAFQTNILALNASVEAARAGEHGKGFAVVASEVRQLANRSATAAQDIKRLIDTSNSQINAGAERVGEAKSRMQEIDARIREVDTIFDEIASAAVEQTGGIEQINDAVSQLDQTTQQNAALVEQTSAMADTLKDRSQALRDAVQRFKV